MQYILTKEEYDELTRHKTQLEFKDREELQALCTKIAETMPIKTTDFWGKESENAMTWGCVLTSDIDYCDECPVRTICPKPHKEFSQ